MLGFYDRRIGASVPNTSGKFNRGAPAATPNHIRAKELIDEFSSVA